MEKLKQITPTYLSLDDFVSHKSHCEKIPSRHNIIQIHNNVVMWESHYIHRIFPIFNLSTGTLYKIMAIPHYIVVDLSNVMRACIHAFLINN